MVPRVHLQCFTRGSPDLHGFIMVAGHRHGSIGRSMGVSTLALALLLAAGPLTIAAPGLRCAGLDEAVCDAYLEHFSTQLAKSGRIAVRTKNDVAQLLGAERQKQLLGCSDGSCLAELAGGLGVDALLSGTVTKTESSWLATLRVLRARDGAELATATERFESSAAMERWLEQQADALAEKLAPAPPAPPVNKPRLALLVGGGVLLAAGAGFFVWSKADAAALKGDVADARIDGLVARGQVTQPLGLALGIAGVACLAGGVAWLALDPGAPAATVAPVPGGGAVISFAGALP